MPHLVKYIFLVLFLHFQLQTGFSQDSSHISSKLLLGSNVELKNSRDAEDLAALLKGVDDIYISGSPAFISVYGSAIPVVSGQMGSGENAVYHPVVAAGRLGSGKIVGVTHDSFLTPENITEQVSDKNQFILNSVQWAASSGSSDRPTVALLYFKGDDETEPQPDPDTLVSFLALNNISTTLIPLEELKDANQLQGYNVVIVKSFFKAETSPILKEYAENGGGLLIGLTSWAWYFFYDLPGHFGETFPGNIVSSDSGFVWRNDEGPFADPIGDNGNYNASTVYLNNTTVLEGWREVKNYLITGGRTSNQSLLQFSSIFQYGLEVIPPKDSFWTENDFYTDALNFTQVNGQPIPSAAKPVNGTFDKFALQIFHGMTNSVLRPEDVQAHPSSVHFPGEVTSQNSVHSSSPSLKKEVISLSFKKPSWFSSTSRGASNPWSFVPNSINTCDDGFEFEGAGRVRGSKPHEEETIEVSNKFPLWYSTGLYAPPGEVITVSVETPDSLDGFQIQIGTHSDDISRHPDWQRVPRVLLRRNLVDKEVTLASPYGGLIYVIIPEDEISEVEKTYQVTITGSVKAPYYKLGETSIRDWRSTIRHESGAWAEFVTDKVILSAPSSIVRELDDPEDLLLFWDQVMDAIADLAAIPRERYRQERLVPDVQISAGFMHSGYPIMTFLNEGALALNVTTLRREGSWGHFHEIGHNHQQSDWTFDGTGETTCNLFALYVLNTVCGIPTENTREQMTPEVYRITITDYLLTGPDFEEWKNQPFLSLMFYVQLQQVYGWVAFKQVFANYHLLEEHPSTEEDKMDLFLIMFSTVVEQDLSLLFESWGIPISEKAASAVSSFPEAGFLIFDLLHD